MITRARGEAEPLVVRRAHVFGQARGEYFRFDRLEQAQLLGAPQPSGIDSHQHIGGGGGAFIAETLDQRILAGLDAVQLDAGGFGEVVVQRLVGLVMAG